MARILIVEDDPILRQLLRTVVVGAGHDAAVASDASEALAMADSVEPELMITDYMLPKMDGVDLVNALRSQEPLRSLPVIVYSAYPIDEKLAPLVREPDVHYVPKGKRMTSLLAQLNEILATLNT